MERELDLFLRKTTFHKKTYLWELQTKAKNQHKHTSFFLTTKTQKLKVAEQKSLYLLKTVVAVSSQVNWYPDLRDPAGDQISVQVRSFSVGEVLQHSR